MSHPFLFFIFSLASARRTLAPSDAQPTQNSVKPLILEIKETTTNRGGKTKKSETNGKENRPKIGKKAEGGGWKRNIQKYIPKEIGLPLPERGPLRDRKRQREETTKDIKTKNGSFGSSEKEGKKKNSLRREMHRLFQHLKGPIPSSSPLPHPTSATESRGVKVHPRLQ